MNGDKKLKEIIDGVNAKLKNTYQKFAPSAAFYGMALRWNLEEPVEITIVTDDTQPEEFLGEINKMFIPQKVVKIFSSTRDKDCIQALRLPLEEAVYVCSGKKCSVPITRAKDLIMGIKRFLDTPDKKNKPR